MPQCEHCKANLASVQSLEYHLKNKVCQKKQCPVCRQLYKNKQGLKYHLENSSANCGAILKLKSNIEANSDSASNIEIDNKKKLVANEGQQGGGDKILLQRKEPLVSLNNFNFAENQKVLDEISNNNNIMSIINVILSSENFKEFWVIYVEKIRSTYFYIYDGNCWQLRPRNMVLEFLCNKLFQINKKFELISKNSTKYKDFKDYICCVLYNNKDNVRDYAHRVGAPLPKNT